LDILTHIWGLSIEIGLDHDPDLDFSGSKSNIKAFHLLVSFSSLKIKNLVRVLNNMCMALEASSRAKILKGRSTKPEPRLPLIKKNKDFSTLIS